MNQQYQVIDHSPSALPFGDADSGHTVPYQTLDDLGILPLIDTLCGGKRDSDELRELFTTPCETREIAETRQSIWRDYMSSDLSGVLDDFSMLIRNVQMASGRFRYSADGHRDILEQNLLLRTISMFCESMNDISSRLHAIHPKYKAMQSLCSTVIAYTSSQTFITMNQTAQSLEKKLKQVKFNIRIIPGKFNIRVDNDNSDEQPGLEEQLSYLAEPFVDNPSLARLVASTPQSAVGHDMDSILQIVLKRVSSLTPEPFHQLDGFAEVYQNFLPSWMPPLAVQIDFMNAWKDYTNRISEQGLLFSLPQFIGPYEQTGEDDSGTHGFVQENVTGLFNVVLASAGPMDHQSIVTNSYKICGDERIMVVTGANQGGKTTFARAVGQLHYFASLGLPVPATYACIRFTPLILTGFASKENLRDQRGKLEDDLLTMKLLLSQSLPDSLLVVNEMFASTTTHDALFISHKLFDIIRKRNYLCVWVTFLSELAAKPNISMVAEVRGDSKAKRTYRIVRKTADGAAHALSLLNIHHLCREDIKKRVDRP